MKFIALAAATAVSATLFTGALAPASAATKDAVVIEYSDLDVSSPEGSAKLEARVEAGVRKACDRPDIRSTVAMRNYEACIVATRSEVKAQLEAQLDA